MCVLSNVNLQHSNSSVVLFPEDPGIPPIDYRELHTIVRELTYGIYVLHQTPLVSLEANYDQSTSCQLPPAYQDTRIGQILVNVDYIMKCLWHGAYIPKDKRTKFSERWRSSLDINQSGKPETKKPLLPEFTSAGECLVSQQVLQQATSRGLELVASGLMWGYQLYWIQKPTKLTCRLI